MLTARCQEGDYCWEPRVHTLIDLLHPITLASATGKNSTKSTNSDGGSWGRAIECRATVLPLPVTISSWRRRSSGSTDDDSLH